LLLGKRKQGTLGKFPMRNFSLSPIFACVITLAVLFLSLLQPGHKTAGTVKTRLGSAHIERGNRVAQRYEGYGKRLAAYYVSLADAVRKAAPELLSHLQPREPVLHGYQILPPIVSEAPGETYRHASIAYSWPWTDHLIDRALQEIVHAEAELDSARANRQNKALLERLALDYRRLSSQHRNIDAHIQYNRLWQAAIAADPPGYDQETILHSEVLERQKIADRLRRMSAASERSSFTYKAPLRLTDTGISLEARARSLTQRIDGALSQVNTPDFVNVERSTDAWVIRVPLFTDIEDHEFVNTVKQIIEGTWRATDRNMAYRVELDISFISGDALYPERDQRISGQKVDVRRHLKRFPTSGAILTTGAPTTHVQGNAIVLGPHAVMPRVLAHEFGHILGFRDRYVRGYENLGENGFLIMEVVADPEDIMAATPQGAVFPWHFERIINRRRESPEIIPAKLIPLQKLQQKTDLS
jgi:hypothetical protein